MNRLRYLLPAGYAVAIVIGFLISPRVGVGVVIVGAIVLGGAFAALRGKGVEGRQRNRDRRRREPPP